MKKHLFAVGAIVCFVGGAYVKAMDERGKLVPTQFIREGFGCHYYPLCESKGVFTNKRFSMREDRNWNLAIAMIPFLMDADEYNKIVEESEAGNKLLLEPKELRTLLSSFGILTTARKEKFLDPLKKFVSHYKLSNERVFVLAEQELEKDEDYKSKQYKKHLKKLLNLDLQDDVQVVTVTVDLFGKPIKTDYTHEYPGWKKEWQETAEECRKRGKIRLTEHKSILAAMSDLMLCCIMHTSLPKFKEQYRKNVKKDKRKSKKRRNSMKDS